MYIPNQKFDSNNISVLRNIKNLKKLIILEISTMFISYNNDAK